MRQQEKISKNNYYQNLQSDGNRFRTIKEKL